MKQINMIERIIRKVGMNNKVMSIEKLHYELIERYQLVYGLSYVKTIEKLSGIFGIENMDIDYFQACMNGLSTIHECVKSDFHFDYGFQFTGMTSNKNDIYGILIDYKGKGFAVIHESLMSYNEIKAYSEKLLNDNNNIYCVKIIKWNKVLQDYFTMEDESLNIFNWDNVNFYDSINEYNQLNNNVNNEKQITIYTQEKNIDILNNMAFNAIGQKTSIDYIFSFFVLYVLNNNVMNDKYFKKEKNFNYSQNSVTYTYKLHDYNNLIFTTYKVTITQYNVLVSFSSKALKGYDKLITMPEMIKMV